MGMLRQFHRCYNQFRSLSTTLCAQVRWKDHRSYWYEPGTEPINCMNIGHLIDEAAEKYGNKEGLVSIHQNQRFTYTDIKHETDKLAAGFLELGLQKGDSIGIWGPNSSEWYLASLAAAKAGLSFVCINPAYQIMELEFCLKKTKVKALLSAESFKTQNYHKMIGQIIPEVYSCHPEQLESKMFPNLKTLIFMSEKSLLGSYCFKDVAAKASNKSLNAVQKIIENLDPDFPCNIQFTSGTTGFPKGTILSHHNVVNNSYFIGKRMELHKEEHSLCVQIALFHAFGNVIAMLVGLHFGMPLVLSAPNFNVAATINAIQQEKCSMLFGTPTMHVDLLAAVKRENIKLESLQIVANAGASCSPEIFKDLKDTLNLKRVHSFYGMTETSPVTFTSKVDDTFELLTNSVGKVIDHTEVKVVDSSGNIVPFGSPGELCVRGYCVMRGYYGEEKKTMEMIDSNGWLKTGDLFVLDEEGYGRVVGRIKDVIIRGGENIFPKEIEEFLERHEDILEAQVIGIPDDRMGEEVCACIRLFPGKSLTETEIKNYCKGEIAHFKIPKYIRFFEAFPKTESGKIQKIKLRESVSMELNDKSSK